MLRKKNGIPFHMAKENVERMNKCCPQHLLIRTARMKADKEKNNEEIYQNMFSISSMQICNIYSFKEIRLCRDNTFHLLAHCQGTDA